MKEYKQAKAFYLSLSEYEQKDLAEAVADSLVFLDKKLRLDAMEMLAKTDGRLAEEIDKINCFTR